jgi:hypothetical protein
VSEELGEAQDESVPTEEEREFIERSGLFYEAAGGPRTAGRILGWLLICDPPHQSIMSWPPRWA